MGTVAPSLIILDPSLLPILCQNMSWGRSVGVVPSFIISVATLGRSDEEGRSFPLNIWFLVRKER